MSTHLCTCFPCFSKQTAAPAIETAAHIQNIPWSIWESICRNLEPQNLLAASAVCKRWRFAAAKIFLNNSEDRLQSTPCFKEFYEDFGKSRHIIMFDVSSSMTIEPLTIPRAHQMYTKITQFLDKVITKNGLYICKFAAEHKLKYFRTVDSASEFISEDSKLQDGSILSSAVTAIFDKVISLNRSKSTHVHVISDMNVQLDSSIFSASKLESMKGKITFHYYYAAETKNNNFLRTTEEEYLRLKETPLPEAKTKYGDRLALQFYRTKSPKIAPPPLTQ